MSVFQSYFKSSDHSNLMTPLSSANSFMNHHSNIHFDSITTTATYFWYLSFEHQSTTHFACLS